MYGPSAIERVTSVWWDPTGVPKFIPDPFGSDNSYSTEETIENCRKFFEVDGHLPEILFEPMPHT